ncbi:MAG: hypothetical protein EZS28_043095 [Streblomastix strix]|uniref:Uncharacterized protein n=1 Tax=Streblomastix strix TaxID=222440 RepID=A0A5J4TTZ6_9EUKA|nr:MAG: hypothetical protein EZS28_043095 [Streblomastix strix]
MSQSIVDRSQDEEIQNTFILELDNVRIAKCKSDIYGGAIFLGGQLLSGQEYNNEIDVKLIMEKTKFINNEAGNGNDIFIQSRWLQYSVLEGDASSIPSEQTWGGSVNKGTFNNAQSNSQQPRVCGALTLMKQSNELNYDKETNSDIIHLRILWINKQICAVVHVANCVAVPAA